MTAEQNGHGAGPPASVAFVSTVPPPSAAFGELPPGAKIARYVVLRSLGRGGMGVVYMAYDEELDRRIALKLLSSDAKGEGGDGALRLLREAQAMAKLSHPNVVAVHDVGTVGEQVFVAMEYVDGPTLRAWRDGMSPASPEHGPHQRPEGRTPRAIVAMYVQAGRGLEAAHAAGILHRDFKPENAMVDARGRARVLDFGLARIDAPASHDDVAMATTGIASGRSSSAQLTHFGALVGTPAYMAPEQLRGERADPRSDQFAFCVALYEALYGERPYEGRNVMALRDAIAQERARPAPRRSRVPRGVRAALLRGLRAKREDRFASMGELLDALEHATSSSRRQALVIGAVAIAVAGVALAAPRATRAPVCAGADQEIAASWGDAQRASIARAFDATRSPRADETFGRVKTMLDSYATSWARQRTESCEATRVRGVQSDEALDLRTACLDQRRRELDATTAILATANAKLVDDAITMVGSLGDLAHCADVPSLRAPYARPRDDAQAKAVDALRAELAHGTALFHARKLSEAEQALSSVADGAKKIGYAPLEAEARLYAGRAAIEQGKADAARAMLLDAATGASSARDDATEASAWIWLVRVAGYDLGRYEEGELYARLADATLARSGGSDALRSDLARHRAHARYAREEMPEALALYKEALALREKAFGAGSAEAAEVEVDLADIAFDQGRMKEAIALYQSALAKRIAVFGEGNPVVAASLANIANMQEQVGAADDALASAKRALAVIHPEDRFHPFARIVLARALVAKGDVAAGDTEARGALAEYEAQVGSGWKLGLPHDLWAQTLLRRRLVNRAEPEAEKAIASLGSGELDPSTLRWARQIHALCRVRRGAPDDAIAEATRALADEEKENGATSANLMLPLLAIGEAELAKDGASAASQQRGQHQGHGPRALAALERAFAVAEPAEGYPELHADVHVALAKALVATNGADRDRARGLAERAAREYEAVHLADAAQAARALAASMK